MMRFTFLNENQTFGPWAQRVQGQPGWVVRSAALAMVLVVVVPVVLLAAAAIFVGALVFFALSLVAGILRSLNAVFSRGSRSSPVPDQGRRNVRVIDP